MRRLYAIVIFALAAGCVSSGDYERLKERLKAEKAARIEAEEQLEVERAKNQSLTGQRNYAEERANHLRGEVTASREEQEALRASLDGKDAALADARRRGASQRELLAAYQAKFKRLVDAGSMQTSIEDGRLVINLPSDILFDSGQAEVDDDGHELLAEIGKILASLDGKRLQVEGHTDNVPIASSRFPSNWHLAHARAMAVLAIFVDAGVPAPDISAASFSEFRPTASNDTPEGRAQNRRIEVVINPDLGELAH